MVAQNNAIWINYIKAKLDKTQQNSKCRLCDERDETINKRMQQTSSKKYKTRHDWVEKMIHGELCKKVKFDYSARC